MSTKLKPQNQELRTVTRVTEIKNPPNRGAIFQRHVAVAVPTGLKKMTLRNDDVVRQGTWQLAGR